MIDYEYKISSRASRLRLSVFFDGRVSVVAPAGMNEDRVRRFVDFHSAWIYKRLEKFKRSPIKFLTKSGKREFFKYRGLALKIAQERLEYFNVIYSLKFNRITIRNQKSRWGSCSRRGNLSFNYKIALLPDSLLDYVIVHEICHLAQMNHSKKFWDLVSVAIPNYKEARKQMNNIV